MSHIAKELLIGRIKYLEELYLKPGSQRLDTRIVKKVKRMILEGKLKNIMEVETVFNFLIEKKISEDSEVDAYVKEIMEFMN